MKPTIPPKACFAQFLLLLRKHIFCFLVELVRFVKAVRSGWTTMSNLIRETFLKALIYRMDALAFRFGMILLEVIGSVQESNKDEESRLSLARHVTSISYFLLHLSIDSLLVVVGLLSRKWPRLLLDD